MVSTDGGLTPGLEGVVESTVTPGMTAVRVGSGDVPVLATPEILALAERAAVAAVAGRLPPGTTTVGTAVELTHSAPTPVGAPVRAIARLDAVDGRRLRFMVSVRDPVGEVAGGVHTRVMVDRERFEATARERIVAGTAAAMEAGLRVTDADHVNLLMPPDGEPAARAFYVGVLGLTEVPKPEPLASRGGCWFRSDGIDLHLSRDSAFVPATRAHVGLLVADLEAATSTLAAAGAPVTRDDSVVGVHRLYTADPFGNRIELIQSGEGFRERRLGHAQAR